MSFCSWPRPLADLLHRLEPFARAQTIREPSGDHRGLPSGAGSKVKRVLMPRVRSIVQISGAGEPASTRRIATLVPSRERLGERYCICLLYTSDAADERSSVDLGGRR